MRITSFASTLAALALVACGASEPAQAPVKHPGHGAGEVAPAHGQHGDASKMHGAGGHAEHKGDKHEHNFPAEVNAFHDVLSPVWHADKGAERTDNTCAAVDDMKGKAQAVIDAGAPAEVSGDHTAAWQTSAADLRAAVVALETACAADGRPDFEATFSALHDRFHDLVKHVGHEDRARSTR